MSLPHPRLRAGYETQGFICSATQLYHQMTRELSSDADKTMAPWVKHEGLRLDP